MLRQDIRSAGQRRSGPPPGARGRRLPHPGATDRLSSICPDRHGAHRARGRLDQELREQVTTWRWHPVVDALQALRGVQFTVAVTMVAEIGDLTR